MTKVVGVLPFLLVNAVFSAKEFWSKTKFPDISGWHADAYGM